MLSVQWWHDRLYRDAKMPVTLAIEQIDSRVTPACQMLDIGAGAGEKNAYDFRGRCGNIVGVDFDPRVQENPLLDTGFVMDGAALPFPDESFDVAFSIYVLEHVDDADGFAKEVARVLRPGGVFISVTPNKWHYVPLMARLTPTEFHKWFNRTRGREADDTFPTRYRVNTAGAQRKWFGRHGLTAVQIDLVECEPQYLKFALPAYLLGVVYERVVNSTRLFAPLRVNIVSTFRKPDQGKAA